MDPVLRPLAAIFELNTHLLVNCLDGLTDAAAGHRLPGGGNNTAFLVAHVTDARHFLADLLGSTLVNPLADLLADASSIDDVAGLPPLTELRSAWLAVAAELASRLETLTSEDLARTTKQRFPIRGGTVLDAVAFLAQHDSYHVGQIAFLRRQVGLPAMSYRQPDEQGTG